MVRFAKADIPALSGKLTHSEGKNKSKHILARQSGKVNREIADKHRAASGNRLSPAAFYGETISSKE